MGLPHWRRVARVRTLIWEMLRGESSSWHDNPRAREHPHGYPEMHGSWGRPMSSPPVGELEGRKRRIARKEEAREKLREAHQSGDPMQVAEAEARRTHTGVNDLEGRHAPERGFLEDIIGLLFGKQKRHWWER